MKHQFFSAAALAVVFTSLGCLQGCGSDDVRWVSQDEYLNTSMSHDSRMATDNTTYGYTPPPMDAWPDDHPLVTPRYEETPQIIMLDSPASENPVSYERSTYASETRQKLDAMQRELDRVNAKAIQKGASVIAATDPKVRDFNSARRRIDELLTNAAAASASDWQDRTMRINFELDLARRAVMEATNLANTTPPTQNP